MKKEYKIGKKGELLMEFLEWRKTNFENGFAKWNDKQISEILDFVCKQKKEAREEGYEEGKKCR